MEDHPGVIMVRHGLHVVHPGGMTEGFRGMSHPIVTTDGLTIEVNRISMEANTVDLTMIGISDDLMITTAVVESLHVDILKTIIIGQCIEFTEEMKTIEDIGETKKIEDKRESRIIVWMSINLVGKCEERPSHPHLGETPFLMQVV